MNHTDIIPGAMVLNTDIIFIFPETDPDALRRTYKQVAGIVPNFESFYQIMKTCTQDYGCLVIKYNFMSHMPYSLEDCLFWYKAEPPPDFKLSFTPPHHLNQNPPLLALSHAQEAHPQQPPLPMEEDPQPITE